MADVTLAPADATRAVATAPNFTTGKTAAIAANVYYIPNNGRVKLIVAAGTTANVTITRTRMVDGQSVPDLVIALGDTGQRVIGPFPTDTYNDGQGRMKVTVSANCDIYPIRD